MGPDIASIAAVMGEPARASMLLGLMDGRALTATELACLAEVAPSTASAHLAKLTTANLVAMVKQGRHRYFRIADARIAELIETMCTLAPEDPRPQTRLATGPPSDVLREARVCYDHLAGTWGVRLLDGLLANGWLRAVGDATVVTQTGTARFEAIGIDVIALESARRPTCRRCLDWSARRFHLGGGLGAALLDRILANRWADRDLDSRALRFTESGARGMVRAFGIERMAAASR